MRFTVLGAIVLSTVVCPRDGARVRPALRSLSVVRQLWRRREWRLELRISHPRAMPGDRERHRRILRSQPVLQSATGRRTPAPAQPLGGPSRAFDTHAAHPSGPGELICRELCCRCTTHERRHAMRIRTIVLATLALSTTVLAQAPASALPYDPYPWCAVYGGRIERLVELRLLAPGTSAWRR